MSYSIFACCVQYFFIQRTANLEIVASHSLVTVHKFKFSRDTYETDENIEPGLVVVMHEDSRCGRCNVQDNYKLTI